MFSPSSRNNGNAQTSITLSRLCFRYINSIYISYRYSLFIYITIITIIIGKEVASKCCEVVVVVVGKMTGAENIGAKMASYDIIQPPFSFFFPFYYCKNLSACGYRAACTTSVAICNFWRSRQMYLLSRSIIWRIEEDESNLLRFPIVWQMCTSWSGV